ncbi:MAG: SurA N-terminal domain-containing protein [Bacteroidaceae bacterium]|nr:SurA N-terminal domain-containing protein [Bacteroidaceae bacterium]
MAALGKIRKHGVLLVSAIAVALFLFVAGDLFKGGQSIFQQQQMTVAEINGESITIQDYQKLIDELQGYYEIINQKNSNGEDDMNRIKDEAWQTYVQSTLVQKECDELGLTVTDDEVAEIIKAGQSQLLQVPLFMNQQTGRYDYAQVQAFLQEYQQLKSSGSEIPEAYEKIYKYYMFAQKQIRTQQLVQKYQVLMAKALISNPVEAKMNFEGRNSETDVILASIPFNMVADDKVNVSDEEIKAKYNEDKAMYEQINESRDIKFIDVAITANDADKKAAEENMQEAYRLLSEATSNTAAGNVCRQQTSQVLFTDILKGKEAYPQMIAAVIDSIAVGETTEPQFDVMSNAYYTVKLLDKQTEADSVLFRQIAVAGADEAASKKTADSIVTAIKGGAAFADIAKKYNQPSDSTWLTTAQYQYGNVDADNGLFIKSIYGMQPNEVKSIKLSNGYNVVLQVLDKKNPITKYNVASVVKTLNFSDKTYSDAYNKFSSFLAKNKTLEQIEANADKEGYTVQTLADVVNNQHNIAGVHGTRDALKWLFDDASVNDVSQLYQCGDNDHLFVAALTGINKKGFRSLEKVTPNIKAELMNDKKAEQLIEKLNGTKTISEAIQKGGIPDTINHVSFAAPAFVRATAASEPMVSAMASKTEKGQVVGPFKGDQGVYVMQVINKTKTAEKFDAKSEEAQLSQMNQRAAFQNIINSLYLKANVKDNRYKFF